jgi:hypothetical protein
MRCVVQFPHPSAEHPVKGEAGVMPWNTGHHRRKFLKSAGRAVIDVGSPAVEGEYAFWGEWEAESRFERLPKRDKGYPRAVHQPFWRTPLTSSFRQNTDPWVFGEAFRYTNCKQYAQGRPAALQRLERGSLILFGGVKDGAFLVDTVFVVASATPWSPDAPAEVVDATLRVVTCESVATHPEGKGLELTLYQGATPEAPVDGMFSFVPAQLVERAVLGFVKPAISLPGLVNPRSKQAPKKSLVDGEGALAAWTSVRDQVLSHGLVLGTSFATPQREEW